MTAYETPAVISIDPAIPGKFVADVYLTWRGSIFRWNRNYGLTPWEGGQDGFRAVRWCGTCRNYADESDPTVSRLVEVARQALEAIQ